MSCGSGNHSAITSPPYNILKMIESIEDSEPRKSLSIDKMVSIEDRLVIDNIELLTYYHHAISIEVKSINSKNKN
jgi:hypothetical protein